MEPCTSPACVDNVCDHALGFRSRVLRARGFARAGLGASSIATSESARRRGAYRQVFPSCTRSTTQTFWALGKVLAGRLLRCPESAKEPFVGSSLRPPAASGIHVDGPFLGGLRARRAETVNAPRAVGNCARHDSTAQIKRILRGPLFEVAPFGCVVLVAEPFKNATCSARLPAPTRYRTGA